MEQDCKAVSNNPKSYRGWGFKPGKSGNPKGRPKRDLTFAEIARKMLDSKEIKVCVKMENGKTLNYSMKSDKTIKHAIMAALMQSALHGSIQAAKEIMDRVDGKVKEVIEMSEPGPLVVMNEEKHDTIDVQATESLEGDSGQSGQAAHPV